MFPLVCLLCLTLTVPNLALTYRLVRNKLFGSVFNLHSVFMFLLTAVKTPLSVATILTLITGAENFHEFSCYARPMIDLIWGGSMVLGTFYNLLFKYDETSRNHNCDKTLDIMVGGLVWWYARFYEAVEK